MFISFSFNIAFIYLAVLFKKTITTENSVIFNLNLTGRCQYF